MPAMPAKIDGIGGVPDWNRRAFRAGEEPLDTFRRYMGVYAREQAYCHFSPALVSNLEKNWKKK